MGLLEKLRAELVDIIEWVDHTKDLLVWRFPRYHNQIKNGAQLIVRPGQVAVFVHRGKLADVFEPGHYELTTSNLPMLGTLQGWAYGFDSPFKSEVYFVNTRQVTDLKWGTPNPIMLRDSDFGPIRLRAFGTYALKVSSASVLLTELVGAGEDFEANEIHELVRSIIHTSFAEMLGKAQIAALDLASNYHKLSEQLRREVVARVAGEYGLDVPQLFIVNISLPEAVEKALDSRTSMSVIGDMSQWQQFQVGNAMTTPGAAAGEWAGAGAGMGVGMAMAQRATASTGAMVPPPPATATGAAMWHVLINGNPQGPFTMDQLSALIADRTLTRSTFVWSAGMSNWAHAGGVPALGPMLSGSMPPPPPKA